MILVEDLKICLRRMDLDNPQLNVLKISLKRMDYLYFHRHGLDNQI